MHHHPVPGCRPTLDQLGAGTVLLGLRAQPLLPVARADELDFNRSISLGIEVRNPQQPARSDRQDCYRSKTEDPAETSFRAHPTYCDWYPKADRPYSSVRLPSARAAALVAQRSSISSGVSARAGCGQRLGSLVEEIPTERRTAVQFAASFTAKNILMVARYLSLWSEGKEASESAAMHKREPGCRVHVAYNRRQRRRRRRCCGVGRCRGQGCADGRPSNQCRSWTLLCLRKRTRCPSTRSHGLALVRLRVWRVAYSIRLCRTPRQRGICCPCLARLPTALLFSHQQNQPIARRSASLVRAQLKLNIW